jgi:hypothetical protein
MLANTENPQISGRSLERKTMPIFGQVLLAERLKWSIQNYGEARAAPNQRYAWGTAMDDSGLVSTGIVEVERNGMNHRG